MDTKARIKKEKVRLLALYQNIPANKLSLVTPLIERAAFLQITLEDLEKMIITDGCIDEYKNGENQYGTKQSASLQSYNNLVKSYQSVIDKLDKMLPAESKKDSLAEMMAE